MKAHVSFDAARRTCLGAEMGNQATRSRRNRAALGINCKRWMRVSVVSYAGSLDFKFCVIDKLDVRSMKKGLVPREIMQLKRIPNLAKFQVRDRCAKTRYAIHLIIKLFSGQSS